MSGPEDKIKRQQRRKDHIAKDLRTPKYRPRVVKEVSREEEDERRFRRYHNFDEYFGVEGYHPLDKDNDE